MPTLPRQLLLIASLAAAAIAPQAHAQELVTGISTVFTTQTPPASTSPDVANHAFENRDQELASLTTATGTYTVTGAATYALVQRNGTPNQSSVWYAQGTGTNLAGVHHDTYGEVLRSNNFYEGSDNTFANGTVASAGNIERLDFTYATKITDLSTAAFAVFDRGVASAHDGFTIALVTGRDAVTGAPTSYGAALKITNANWTGTTNVIGDRTYNLFRYTSDPGGPDGTTAAVSATETNTQGIGGLVVRVSDFGVLPAGTEVYGYSLMGVDVSITDLTLLTDATSAAYPTNTDGGSGGGGIDLAAVNGLQLRFSPVPEPGTAALLAIGGGLALMAVLRVQPRR